MGTLGADGSVETNWFVLLHRRVTGRAVRSPRYQWWALVALLAGLLSLNITFTVFVVALPTVKADFNTNFSVLAWASTGPLLAFGVAAPFFGKAGDLFGHRRLYQFGLLGAMVSAILTATAPERRDPAVRPRPRRGAGRRHRHGVDGDHPGAVLPSGPRQGARVVVARRRRRPRARRHAGLAGHPVSSDGGRCSGGSWCCSSSPRRSWPSCCRRTGGFGASATLAATDGRPESAPAPRGSAPASGTAWTGWGVWSLAGSVTAAMLVLSIGPIAGWTSPAVITSGVLAIVLTVVFIRRELTFATPLVPTTYWRRRNFMFPMGTKSVLELRLLRRLLPVPTLDGAGLRLQRVPGRLHLGGPAAPVRHQRADRRLYDGADGGADSDALRHRFAAALHDPVRHAPPDGGARSSS